MKAVGRNPYLKSVLFSFLVFCVFFGLLELLSGIILHFNPGIGRLPAPTAAEGSIVSDMRLNHKWRPALALRGSARGVFYDLFTNGESWLERYEVSRPKPAGTYRIFYLGDSTTQGVVSWDESMVNLLERRLNEDYGGNPRIEVVNTGTSSYSTLLYYLLIRHKLLRYQPDLVVINVDMTDVANDLLYRRNLTTDERGLPAAVHPFRMEEKRRFRMTPEGVIEVSSLGEWDRALYEKSAFYRLLVVLASRWREETPKISPPTGWLPWHTKLDRSANWLAPEWDPSVMENVNYSMEILRGAIGLLRENNVEVMVTGVPHHPQYSGEWSPRPHAVLGEVAEGAGAHYLNSFEAMREEVAGSGVEAYYFESDPTHFNAKGNALWAAAQYRFLTDRRGTLLPEPGGAGP